MDGPFNAIIDYCITVNNLGDLLPSFNVPFDVFSSSMFIFVPIRLRIMINAHVMITHIWFLCIISFINTIINVTKNVPVINHLPHSRGSVSIEEHQVSENISL